MTKYLKGKHCYVTEFMFDGEQDWWLVVAEDIETAKRILRDDIRKCYQCSIGEISIHKIQSCEEDAWRHQSFITETTGDVKKIIVRDFHAILPELRERWAEEALRAEELKYQCLLEMEETT